MTAWSRSAIGSPVAAAAASSSRSSASASAVATLGSGAPALGRDQPQRRDRASIRPVLGRPREEPARGRGAPRDRRAGVAALRRLPQPLPQVLEVDLVERDVARRATRGRRGRRGRPAPSRARAGARRRGAPRTRRPPRRSSWTPACPRAGAAALDAPRGRAPHQRASAGPERAAIRPPLRITSTLRGAERPGSPRRRRAPCPLAARRRRHRARPACSARRGPGSRRPSAVAVVAPPPRARPEPDAALDARAARGRPPRS